MLQMVCGRRIFQFMIAERRDRSDLCSLLLKLSSLKFSSISDPKRKEPHSLTISYLVNSCGLSPESALLASKKLNLKTTENADSVLDLLRVNGFTVGQIAKLVSKIPSVLLSDPDKTLLSRIDVFKSYGISGSDLTKIICSNPTILQSSVKKMIIPCFDFLKSIVHTDENVVLTLRHSSRFFQYNVEAKIAPNISAIREHGVPESSIVKLITFYPRTVLLVPELFSEIVSFVKGLGFDPTRRNFTFAIRVISAMKRSNWERKLECYLSFGWSKDEFFSAFKVQPKCMLISEKKIKEVVKYFEKEMGWKPSMLLKCPNLIIYSLEKRTIPRCLLLKSLITKGLIKNDEKLIWVLNLCEKDFVRKILIKYGCIDPEIPRAYQGLLAR